MREQTETGKPGMQAGDGAGSEKRVLIYATTAYMIDQFNMMNIRMLQDMGYTVDAACNFEFGNPVSAERLAEFQKELDGLGVRRYQLPLTRNILDLWHNGRALRTSIRIMRERRYAFVHCHTPVGSVIARLAGKITGTRVIYTAHGFHFFDGAPLLNWLLYYPIEKFFAGMTDVLITINREDYEQAKRGFRMKRLEYVPGIGIDTEKYAPSERDEEIKAKVSSAGSDDEPRQDETTIVKALPENVGDVTKARMLQVGVGDGAEVDRDISSKEDETDTAYREEIRKDTHERAAVRRELGVGREDFLLLSVGELSKRKNHIAVLRVLAELVTDNQSTLCDSSQERYQKTKTEIDAESKHGVDHDNLNVGKAATSSGHAAGIGRSTCDNLKRLKYLIVGTGKYREELQQFIDTHGLHDTVILAGYRKDTARIYRVADAFVFPSLQEGLPAALMEAMASGLPCAASRIRGNADLLDEQGGFLYEMETSRGREKHGLRRLRQRPGDEIQHSSADDQGEDRLVTDSATDCDYRSVTRTLKEALECLLSLTQEERHVMGIHNAAVIREQFSKERVRDRLQEIYLSMEAKTDLKTGVQTGRLSKYERVL